MPNAARFVAFMLAVLPAVVLVVPRAGAAQSPVPLSRFAGTWVGTQSWAIDNPPPGSRQDQAVTLTIEVADGKVTGSLKPFLGGEDGATFVDAEVVGDELRVSAVVGRPRPAVARGAAPATTGEADTASALGPAAEGRRRGTPPPGWKDPIAIAFVFRNDGVALTGTADVTMSGVPWMKFAYDLGKKRSRY